jgi:hypothetical protein
LAPRFIGTLSSLAHWLYGRIGLFGTLTSLAHRFHWHVVFSGAIVFSGTLSLLAHWLMGALPSLSHRFFGTSV